MLAGTPVHLATECHADCVGGNKLNGCRTVLVPRATPAPVVPDKTCGAQDAVERPDDQSGPEVVAVAVEERKKCQFSLL